MLYNIIIAIMMFLMIIQYWRSKRHIRAMQHELNISETRFVRERRLKEEFYDRYKSIKNEWEKVVSSKDNEEQEW